MLEARSRTSGSLPLALLVSRARGAWVGSARQQDKRGRTKCVRSTGIGGGVRMEARDHLEWMGETAVISQSAVV